MSQEQESHSQEQDGAIARSKRAIVRNRTELEPGAGQNHNREERDRTIVGKGRTEP